MIRKLLCAAVMAVLFAGAGSAFAQGFGGSEAERTGKLYRKTVGFGAGWGVSPNNVTADLSLQVALGQKYRVETAVQFAMAWGLPPDWDYILDNRPPSITDIEEEEGGSAYGYGGFVSFQYRHSISRDGFFNVYGGPLISYTAVSGESGDYRLSNPNATPRPTSEYMFGESFSGGVFGIGAMIGIEWDFSNRIQTADFGIIQVRYRTDYQISLDIRPVINVVRPYDDYHLLHIAVGFTGRYMF
jgi:hypothetical protein